MRKLSILGLLVVGAVLGCAAGAAVAPSYAAPQPGEWSCYVYGAFPNVAAAQQHRDSVAVTKSMNEIAADAPAGTVIALDMYRQSAQLCVKH